MIRNTYSGEFRGFFAKGIFTLLLIFSAIASQTLIAQTISPVVVATSGEFVESNGYSLSVTVGEPVVKTVTTLGAEILTQGFQQPLDVVVSIDEPLPFGWDATVYPNPFADEVYVSITTLPGETYDIGIYNMLGQKETLKVDKIETGEKDVYYINTDKLPVGPYTVFIIPKVIPGNSSKLKL